jgi:formate transporter
MELEVVSPSAACLCRFFVKEDLAMLNETSNSSVTCIGSYKIASADMYYSEMGQRDVFVRDDPEKGFCIWGELSLGGATTTVELCQVFLEYGLFCQACGDEEQACNTMRSFGEHLGVMLAKYLKNTPLLKDATEPGAFVLESVLEAIHAHLNVEHIGPELRFIIAGCPLVDAAARTGLGEVELAQFGFNVMCQLLIHAIDPNLLLHVTRGGEGGEIFTIIKPAESRVGMLAMPSVGSPKEKLEKAQETIDAFPPPAMATRAMEAGVKKSGTDLVGTFMLAILAGAFIAMGAIFATTVTAGGAGLPYGVVRLLSGLAFTLGLIMVVVAGAELFTGNNLIVMAFLSRRVPFSGLLRNWTVVYVGNFVGAMLTAYLVFLSGQYTFGNGVIGLTALGIGETKTGLGFVQAIALGICCNALVCMAVWMCYSARSTVDRILAVVPPIAAFVAAGFEHSVANMYFIPIALFIKYSGVPSFFESVQRVPGDFPHLTWTNFFMANLLPVTVGNIVGGAIMVGVVYWLIYLRKSVRPGIGDLLGATQGK